MNAQFIYPLLLVGAGVWIHLSFPTYFTNDIWTRETWPQGLFWIVALALAVVTFTRKLSLLPILGMVSCFYLMSQETHKVWMRFLIWLIIGLLIYFLYSYSHSKLGRKPEKA